MSSGLAECMRKLCRLEEACISTLALLSCPSAGVLIAEEACAEAEGSTMVEADPAGGCSPSVVFRC